MGILTGFIDQWVSLLNFDSNPIHNTALALLYIRLLYLPVRAIYLIGKRQDDERFPGVSRILKRLMVVLIFNFLVGSAMLEFLQPDSLAYWLPTGWRFDYILLAVVGSLVCISLFIYIPRQIRQIRLEKQSAETMFLKLGRLLLMEFFLFSSLIWGLNHLIVPNRIELDSPVVLFDLDEKPVSVMKIRKTTPNGVEHGISTNISSFLISANDLHSGERLWSRISTWQEYLIGGTTEGLLLLNNKKKTLYFINPETGKKEMNEKEFLEKFPVLADNLSYLYTDYAVANPDELYLYGLDGRYYRINFTTKEITEDPAYADQIRPFSEVWDDEAANKQAEVGKIEELYPELMDVGLIETGQADQQLVVYQKKRNDRRQTLALLDLTKRHVIWEQLLDAPPENADTSLVIDQDEQFAYAWTGRYQYKINKQTGEVVYQYDHKRGRLAAGQTSRRSI